MLSGVGIERVQSVVLLLSPSLMQDKGSSATQNDSICSTGEGLSTGILVSVSSALFSQTSYSPHMALAFSAYTLPKTRLSGYKQNFVHWALKRLPVSLPERQKPCKARCYVDASF